LAEEDESMLRSIYNYDIDVGINDFKLTDEIMNVF